MPSMLSRATGVAFALSVSALPATLSAQSEKVDQAAMQKIRNEGFNHSQIMETASWLTDAFVSCALRLVSWAPAATFRMAIVTCWTALPV